MTFHNRSGDLYHTVGDPGVDIFTRPDIEAPPVQNGLYYRSRVFPELSAELDDCLTGRRPFHELSLDADQAWNESAWKEPHASLAAFKRFKNKFREEVREVEDALEEFWDTRKADHFIEELGDLKWVTTALASNSGVIVSDAIKSRLYDYVAGTRLFDAEREHIYPRWHAYAGSLAIKQGALDLGDIDQLIDEGFVPQPSATMNIDHDEHIHPTVFLNDFILHGHILHAAEERYKESGLPLYLTPHEEAVANRPIADMYLQIAAMAHYADSTLAQVVHVNIDKVITRITTGTVDKSDGERAL